MGTAVVLLVVAGLLMVATTVYWWMNRAAAPPRRTAKRYSRVRGLRVVRRGPDEPEKPARRSPTRAGFGVAIALVAMAAGVLFTAVEENDLPEERGFGLVAWAKAAKGSLRQVEPAPGRGMVLSSAVRVNSCGEPVEVTVFATGTAEFWIDQARRLRNGGRLALAIPDLDITDVKVALAGDGKVASVAPLSGGPDQEAGRVSALPVDDKTSVTVVSADIPDWGRHFRPVMVSFKARWLERRSLLGSCFLRLPALAGFPTVLSAREITGGAVPDVAAISCETQGDEENPCGIFTVSSEETGLEAYYAAAFETTRGVTSLDLGSHALRGELSQPGPDTNLRGSPSWTCSTSAGRSVDSLDTLDRSGPVPDILEVSPDESVRGGVWSREQLGTALGEKTCASYAVIEHASAAVARDIVGLLIGALFSFGVGLFLEGTRRTRRAPEA